VREHALADPFLAFERGESLSEVGDVGGVAAEAGAVEGESALAKMMASAEVEKYMEVTMVLTGSQVLPVG